MTMRSDNINRRRAAAGFSLVEVLLAIFILGIGIISIAALFPAGIAQQRRTVDDIMGPVVADNALSVLRSKLDPEMFGTFEEFGRTSSGVPYRPPMPTEPGDWPWLRPGVMRSDVPDTVANERGMIDVFSALYFRDVVVDPPVPGYEGTGARLATEFPDGFLTPIDQTMPPSPGGAGGAPLDPMPLFGIPFNRTRTDTVLQNLPNPLAPGLYPPAVTFTQAERTFPTRNSENRALNPDNLTPPEQQRDPQYYWDCMFRRYEGRILVAIFVYRVSIPPAVNAQWHLDAHPNDGTRPWLPYRLDLTPEDQYEEMSTTDLSLFADSVNGNKMWDVPIDPNDPPPTTVPGNDVGSEYRPANLAGTSGDGQPLGVLQSWQESGQWILDQNNRVYRVVAHYRDDDDIQRVELSRPIAPVSGTNNMFGSFAPAPGRATHSPYYYLGSSPRGVAYNAQPVISGSFVYEDVVTSIWYMPRYVEFDTNNDGTADTTATLTPVHVQVSEL